MKPIEYRAWHIKHKKYYKVDRIYFDYFNNEIDEVYAYMYHDGNFIDGTVESRDKRRKPQIILEEYIGCRDKNGKKAFKGDIVKLYRDGEVLIAKIHYNEFMLSYVFESLETVGVTYLLDYQNSTFEVIGNINEVKSDEWNTI